MPICLPFKISRVSCTGYRSGICLLELAQSQMAAQSQMPPGRFHAASMAMAFLCSPWYGMKNENAKAVSWQNLFIHIKCHKIKTINKLWSSIYFWFLCCLSLGNGNSKPIYSALKLFFQRKYSLEQTQICNTTVTMPSVPLRSHTPRRKPTKGWTKKSTCLKFLTHNVSIHPRITRTIPCRWSQSSIGEKREQVKAN